MISLFQQQANFLSNASFLDGGGECGSMVHFAFVIAFVGGAFLIFLYLWRKDKLDMDEEPKMTMMKPDETTLDHESEEEGDGRGGA